jgi:hypothetical protein
MQPQDVGVPATEFVYPATHLSEMSVHSKIVMPRLNVPVNCVTTKRKRHRDINCEVEKRQESDRSRECPHRTSPAHLTVKLRGRPEAPSERRGRTLPFSARGAKPQAHHGPLQRLLGGRL